MEKTLLRLDTLLAYMTEDQDVMNLRTALNNGGDDMPWFWPSTTVKTLSLVEKPDTNQVKRIDVNIEFVNECCDELLKTIIKHEAMHYTRSHSFRKKIVVKFINESMPIIGRIVGMSYPIKGALGTVCNLAFDMEINSILAWQNLTENMVASWTLTDAIVPGVGEFIWMKNYPLSAECYLLQLLNADRIKWTFEYLRKGDNLCPSLQIDKG